MDTIFQITKSDLNSFLTELKDHITKEVRAIHHNSEDATEQPISPKQAAAYLRICMSTFYYRIKSGEIPTKVLHRHGRKVWLFKSELKQYCKES